MSIIIIILKGCASFELLVELSNRVQGEESKPIFGPLALPGNAPLPYGAISERKCTI